MTAPTICYLRETNLLTDDEVRAYVAAQQVQITRDFLPRWRLDAVCVFAATAYDVPDGAWPIIFQDDAPEADALGIHDDRGRPYGVVAVRGDPLPFATASHETTELRVDPTIERTVVVDGVEYAFEVADACEDDRFAYAIDGIMVSAFVTPAWFDPAGTYPFVFPIVPEIDAPFKLAPGGYIGVRTPPDGTWSQRFADGARGRRTVKGPTSRTMRRFSAA